MKQYKVILYYDDGEYLWEFTVRVDALGPVFAKHKAIEAAAVRLKIDPDVLGFARVEVG